ncbi:MAG: YitT family protein [Gemmataceae bacterium]
MTWFVWWWRTYARCAFFLVLAILIAWLGLASFLLPNKFIDGGVTGVSMLTAELFHVPLPIVIVVVNLPFLLVGYRRVGVAFAIRAAVAIAGLAICLAVLPQHPATSDKLLSAIFGGMFVGAGVGMAIRGGAVLDGTEILAVLVSRNSFATIGEIILGLNVIIFSVAAIIESIDMALYSALTYFAASKMIDYVLHGIEAYNGVMIFSNQHDEIQNAILVELHRGATTFPATGGYSNQPQQVIFCVVTRLEVGRLRNLVASIDEHAFLVVSPVHETHGGIVKKRGFH